MMFYFFFFFQAEDGIRDLTVTGVQTCALPICNLSPDCAVLQLIGSLGLDAAFRGGVLRLRHVCFRCALLARSRRTIERPRPSTERVRWSPTPYEQPRLVTLTAATAPHTINPRT